MAELRREYRDRLTELEDQVLSMGNRVLLMLDDAMRALLENDEDIATAVVRADAELDERYLALQSEIFEVLALQAPVASELRLLVALLHSTIHIERMGDLCVNVCRFVEPGAGPDDDAVMAQLRDMGQHASRVLTRALEALGRRDTAAARELSELDDPLDRLNRAVFRRLVDLAAEHGDRFDWSLKMLLVARYLERLGDHAVDLGEQVVFAVTGETVELNR